MRGIGAVVCGVLVFAVTATTRGAEFVLTPTEASGGYTIVGDEIILDDGGQTVTFEIRMSGWDPDLDGSPRLGAFQASMDSSGYFGVNAVPPNPDPDVDLNPLGWPDDGAQGGFQILKRCTIGGTPDINGTACRLTPDCPSGESCVDNPDWVFAGLNYIAAVATVPLAFKWGGAVFGGGAADDGGSRYGGTLILEVPADAVGTYTIRFNPSRAETFMNSGSASKIYGLALVPARIT
ncbi:MAG: hypothetical protein KJ749_06435, partial [Planctomycetes bacterium]|nr:hypothetical protein [Planctomycetota bacterium]